MDGDVFAELLELARRLGIVVRHAHLGGNGGGLAKLKDKRHLFVDLDAEPLDQLDQTVRAVAGLPELGGVYVRPDLRKLLDDWAGRHGV